MVKVGRKENRADLTTKPLGKEEIAKFMKALNQNFATGRPESAPQLR